QLLTYAGDPVLRDRHFKPVPVRSRRLRQLVGEEYSHAVAFDDFYRRPRATAVVTPDVNDPRVAPRRLREKFDAQGLGHQVEHFDSVLELVRQLRQIWRVNGQES